MNLPENFIPVFHHALHGGKHGERVLVGYARPGQSVHDLMVHVTVPHVMTSRPHVIVSEEGDYDLWEQRIGKLIQQPIARAIFDWDVDTYPDGTGAMEARTLLIQSKVDSVPALQAELKAAGIATSVLHPGAPAAKPWGIKEDVPEDEVYDVLRPFMLGKQVKILARSATNKYARYEYVGTLANYVVAFDDKTEKPAFVTFRFTLSGNNEDVSLSMSTYILEIELIRAS